jgi:hypothetical protein
MRVYFALGAASMKQTAPTSESLSVETRLLSCDSHTLARPRVCRVKRNDVARGQVFDGLKNHKHSLSSEL